MHDSRDEDRGPGTRHRATADDYFVVKPLDREPSEAERALLLKIYAEVGTNWRDLHGVRFKLLGLLPLVTAGVLSLGAGAVTDLYRAFGAIVVSGLGLAVTQGLHIYDRRNSELYNDLISRGRRIEAELGIDVGAYRGRRRPVDRGIDHGSATGLIYAAVKAAWFASLIAAILAFATFWRAHA